MSLSPVAGVGGSLSLEDKLFELMIDMVLRKRDAMVEENKFWKDMF